MGALHNMRNSKKYKKNTVKKFLAFSVCSAFLLNGVYAYAKQEIHIDQQNVSTYNKIKSFLYEKLGIHTDFDYAAEESAAAYFFMADKHLILVNNEYRLDEAYAPENTIDIAKHIKSTKSQILMEEDAGYSLISMFKAMEEDGISDLAAVSGYRSYTYQENLFKNQMARYKNLSYEEAYKKSASVVAPAGQSEHQTGLAVDVSSKEVDYGLSERFKDTEAYAWLSENAYKYGFIIRYTEDKQYITGIIYEPWHLRYVGDIAEDIYLSGLSFEEYIAQFDEASRAG